MNMFPCSIAILDCWYTPTLGQESTQWWWKAWWNGGLKLLDTPSMTEREREIQHPSILQQGPLICTSLRAKTCNLISNIYVAEGKEPTYTACLHTYIIYDRVILMRAHNFMLAHRKYSLFGVSHPNILNEKWCICPRIIAQAMHKLDWGFTTGQPSKAAGTWLGTCFEQTGQHGSDPRGKGTLTRKPIQIGTWPMYTKKFNSKSSTSTHSNLSCKICPRNLKKLPCI